MTSIKGVFNRVPGPERPHKVYFIIDEETGIMLYIGRTSRALKERLTGHLFTSKSINPMLLSEWIWKHGSDNLGIYLVEDYDTYKESVYAELHFIRLFQPPLNKYGINTHTAESLIDSLVAKRMRDDRLKSEGAVKEKKQISEEQQKRYCENRKIARAKAKADAIARGLLLPRGRKRFDACVIE